MATSEPSASESTGIVSRGEILEVLERLVRGPNDVVVISAKLEGMKSFNHAHGIRLGDQLIEVIEGRMRTRAGDTAKVGKLSGDIFLIIAESSNPYDFQSFVAEAAEACARPVQLGDVQVRPRLKIGIARAIAGCGNVDALMIEASAAMRAAEASGSVDVVTADQDIRTAAHIETMVDRDLPQALKDGELSVAYQPVVTLNDSAVHGAEALLRWNHPEIGFVNPALVMERVEAVGLTRAFTKWCADRVTSEWAQTLRDYDELRGLSVSMNLNERQLADRECAAIVHSAVRESELNPEGLIIEVVESGRIGEAAEASLRALAEAGSIVVLDDFGTGFNALEYFLRFPVHGIKFDRSLTHTIATNNTSLVIVQGVAEMADRLGVATVGEGIETVDDATKCRDLGLTFGQGWHFGRPIALADFVALARTNRADRAETRLDRETFAG